MRGNEAAAASAKETKLLYDRITALSSLFPLHSLFAGFPPTPSFERKCLTAREIHKLETQLHDLKEQAEAAPVRSPHSSLLAEATLPAGPNDTFFVPNDGASSQLCVFIIETFAISLWLERSADRYLFARQEKVARLEAENARLKAATASSEKLADLENRLDDAERLNHQYQQVCPASFFVSAVIP